jgi:DNA-binding transcriptional LysR family regulator
LADQALAALNRKRRIVLTVNQYFTAGRVVANSNLLTVLPAYFVSATGYREQVVTRPLPFHLDGLHVAMLWHQRNDRVSSHQWLRARLLEAAAQQTV